MKTDAMAEGVTVVFGAGYVGGELARLLAARGARVVALTRNAETCAQLRTVGVEPIQADLASVDWHTHAALAGPIARVAVTVAAGGGGAEGYRRSYVDGLASVLAWGRKKLAARERLGPLVYTGSTSVYPQGDGRRVTELDPVGGEAETTRALIEAEGLALAWPGAGSVVLRLAGIYGPGRTHLIGQVRAGDVSGRPDTHLNLIHRDDIPSAIEAAWGRARPAGDVLNLSDGATATKGEIVAWLAERLGVPPPSFTGQPAGGRRAVTPDRIIDATRARRELGWSPMHQDYRSGYADLATLSE